MVSDLCARGSARVDSVVVWTGTLGGSYTRTISISIWEKSTFSGLGDYQHSVLVYKNCINIQRTFLFKILLRPLVSQLSLTEGGREATRRAWEGHKEGHEEGHEDGHTDLLQCPQGGGTRRVSLLTSYSALRAEAALSTGEITLILMLVVGAGQSTWGATDRVLLRERALCGWEGGGYYRTKLCSHTGYNMVIQGIW